jgi:hypothetical protein
MVIEDVMIISAHFLPISIFPMEPSGSGFVVSCGAIHLLSAFYV